ncbi:MAG TPA: hypothetical protein VFB42_01180 [Gaiellaceae bacterium]|nr:hypothetical protein [Gaiellaceae bacterium]
MAIHSHPRPHVETGGGFGRMRRGRRLALLVFVPIGVYLAGMLAIAAFVVRPPASGWIGLGVLAALALLAGAAALVLVPRLRANAPRRHPRPGPLYRLLVVSDADVEPGELATAVGARVVGRAAEVRVVAPIVAGPLHFLTEDERQERGQAGRRLHAALRSLEAAGIHARGAVGTDDPLQAAGDALAAFPADEILVVAPLPSARSWLEDDFELRARDLFGVPVTTVFGTPARPPRGRPLAAHR